MSARTRASVCVLLCRGCCCGTERKHPDVDHAAQERAFRIAAAEGGGRVILTRCLDVCERSNVVVVKTAQHTHWFGDVLRPEQTEALSAFLRSGGASAPPAELSFNVVPRRTRGETSCAACDVNAKSADVSVAQ